ncbi:hypothetical protein NP233_g5785 [Leucocoprinus birnbaumii]|uniref:N-acetyltransferase domain-containing protein n=1 Tax=Leucocoprinus birnbaumii TaxID=56174 RepID=A0AAD5YQL8_9AGAR|nr:hypothetical protein NP233_g5785 [Leucocoprinus birnbaumii]
MSSSPIMYRQYTGESDLPHIMALVQNELSEPYVIYTFRYFLHQCYSSPLSLRSRPHLSFLVRFCPILPPSRHHAQPQAYPSDPATSDPIGVIVCKQSIHRNKSNRGYIAMLSVDKNWRKRGIASALVRNSIDAMKEDGVEEIVLETEYDNHPALSLYESLGFIREKRLYRFYLNGKDAFRLVLSLPPLGDSDDTDDTSSDSGSGTSVSLTTKPSGASVVPIRCPPYRAINVIPYSDDEDDYVSGR